MELTRALPRSASMSALAVGVAVLGTAVAAHVRLPLPFTPVPLSFQTLAVLLGAALLGARKGALAQAIYLGLGAAGLPVLAGAAGLAAVAGPTGGYLAGFVLAALVVGRLLDGRPASTLRAALVFAAGALLILAAGALGLMAWGLSAKTAVVLGVLPFLIGDVAKVVVLTSTYRLLVRETTSRPPSSR